MVTQFQPGNLSSNPIHIFHSSLVLLKFSQQGMTNMVQMGAVDLAIMVDKMMLFVMFKA